MIPARRSALVVGLISTLPYLQTVGFGLVGYDDPWLIADNALLSQPSLGALGQIWFDLSEATRLRLGAEYLPVRDMSVMLDHALFGQAYGWFHLINVLLHALVCGVAVLVLARWTGHTRLAAMAGLLFAMHPVHAEAVAWLSERKGLLAALFALTSALTFLRFCRAGGLRRRLAWLALTAALVALSCWSKAVGVASVGLLAALLLFFPGQARQASATLRQAWTGLAVVAVAAVLALAPVFIVGQALVVEQRQHGGGALGSLWLGMRLLGLNLSHLFWPADLGIRYDIPAGSAAGAAGVAFTLASVALLFLGLFRAGARPAVAQISLGLVLFWAFYLPVSQLIFPLQNLAADRYLLLPSLGLCLIVAVPLARIPRQSLGLALTLCLALSGGLLSLVQTKTWANNDALNRQALKARPGDLGALLQLSAEAREFGNLDRAQYFLGLAKKAHGEVSGVLLHQALLLLRQGKAPEAIPLLRRAARADPLADKARANLALLLMRRGRQHLPEALDWARRAVKIRAQRVHNQRTLGVVAMAAGQLRMAEAAFRLALNLQPHDPTNWYNLGLACAQQGKTRDARRFLNGALKIKPGMASAKDLMRQIEGREGR